RVSMAGPGGGDGGGGPFVDTCDIANVPGVQNAHGSVSSPSSNPHIDIEGASWASPPTPGNLLICAWMSFAQQASTPGTMTGWTQLNTTEAFVGVGGSGGTITVYWKIAEASE